MLSEDDKKNFQTLLRACHHDDAVCLLDCVDKKTGKRVATICITSKGDNEEIFMMPVARMLGADALEELIPPMKEEVSRARVINPGEGREPNSPS